ncbi:uncharacterized protein UV8b_00187 [Ustilaginoidea virens]|uniref:Uncharacterized protein n=1 Tax=Ustilaginoidea virens TaxID=1159556 RepID=A0A8E5MDC6_USTVR|nr:uncharacterized protein UV8b_00187 [Ustilaginoidea virens]QUC15946.1 hypothetical protein UV8b_00187 [Ustilaginoidea virens]
MKARHAYEKDGFVPSEVLLKVPYTIGRLSFSFRLVALVHSEVYAWTTAHIDLIPIIPLQIMDDVTNTKNIAIGLFNAAI